MNEQLPRYKEAQQELMRQIQTTMKNKTLLQDTLKEWQEQLKRGTIDTATYTNSMQQFLQGRSANEWNKVYDDHVKKCNQGLVYYAEKINELEASEETKGSIWPKVGIVAVALVLFFTFLAFSDTKITGLFIFGEDAGKIVFEDGYTREGTRWSEIKGDHYYERCLKIKSEADFTAAKVMGKVTRATEGENMQFILRNDNKGDPAQEVGSCEVRSYEDVIKSCTIKNLEQNKGDYWVCASHPEGDKDQTYFTIAYRVGGERKTALWTGKSWQKLDRSSYTMRVQFMNDDA
ncbi:hypothetical protein HYS50_01430 [Candidatus Woesearchaeota archaeon]|nr:hypothetical protein [Candidatus Woesearchaeota archaeon]